jgi:hypothetical protein
MTIVDALLADTSKDVDPSRCVVRVQTSAWGDKRGVHIKKSLTYLRRQCIGFNVLEEDVSAIGAEDVVSRIINLDKCKDGMYQVVACNERRDWETGYVDDYDLKLVPFSMEETAQ